MLVLLSLSLLQLQVFRLQRLFERMASLEQELLVAVVLLQLLVELVELLFVLFGAP